MGWKVGQGLGLKGDGIIVPVVLRSQVATLGLGKDTEDDRLGCFISWSLQYSTSDHNCMDLGTDRLSPSRRLVET